MVLKLSGGYRPYPEPDKSYGPFAPTDYILHFISRPVKSSCFKGNFFNWRDYHQARLPLSTCALAFLPPSVPKEELNILFLFFHAFTGVEVLSIMRTDTSPGSPADLHSLGAFWPGLLGMKCYVTGWGPS